MRPGLHCEQSSANRQLRFTIARILFPEFVKAGNSLLQGIKNRGTSDERRGPQYALGEFMSKITTKLDKGT